MISAQTLAGVVGLLAIAVPLAGQVQEVVPPPQPTAVPLSHLLEDLDEDFVPDHLSERFSVQGVATTPLRRARDSARGPDWFFVNMMDESGAIRVLSLGSERLEDILPGMWLVATGTLTHRRGSEELVLDSIRVTDRFESVEPLDLFARDVQGEGFMHRLVRLEGTARDYDPAEERFYLVDRTGAAEVRVTTRLLEDPELARRLHEGGNLTVLGIVGQSDREPPFDSDYRVAPRAPEDIIWPSEPPLLTLALGAIFLLVAGLLVSTALRRRAARHAEELRVLAGNLEASEAEFRGLFEGDPVARFVLDPEGRVRRWNQPLEVFLGLSPTEIEGRPPSELLSGFPQEGTEGESPQSPAQVEVRNLAKGGTSKVGILTLAQPESDADGAVHGSILDISLRRELEAQLLRQQKMETVGRLAGGVAHDVNNQLSVILGNVDLIRTDGRIQGVLDEELEEMREAAKRASGLTRRLLTMARRDTARPTALHLASVIREMVPVFRRVIGSDIELVTLLDGDAHTVLADLAQVEQVLMNLVVNAREAMPQGGKIHIELTTPPGGGDEGPRSTLRVSDTGHGMDEETLSNLFDPFFSTKEDGSGLGLSTVYGVITQAGGTVTASSQPGEGSMFEVSLPKVRAPFRLETEEPIPGEEPREGDRPLGYRVLIAEDEDTLRALARRTFERAGCVVVEAGNGEEALRAFSKDPSGYHGLVTDLVMPLMGGWDLADEVRKVRPGFPIVFMSGYVDRAGVRGRLRGHSDIFLEKPFAPDELVKALVLAIKVQPGG